MKLVTLACVLACLVFGCEGPRGPQGEMGQMGERGPRGPRGPRGDSGASFDFDGGFFDDPVPYVPRLWMSCSRALDLTSVESNMPEPDGIADTIVLYTLTIYQGGDAQTDCKVDRGAASTSSSSYYPSATAGAAEAVCLVSSDLPPSDAVAGRFQFRTSASGPNVLYLDDPSHPLHLSATPYAEDDCVILRSDAVGTWEELPFGSFFN